MSDKKYIEAPKTDAIAPTEVAENPQTGEKFMACPTCRGEGHVPFSVERSSAPGMTEDPVGALNPALLAGLHKTGAAGGYIDFTAVYPTGVQDQLSEHQGTVFESYEFSDGMARIMTRQEFDKEYGKTLRTQLERARSNRRENAIDASYVAPSPKPAASAPIALTDEHIRQVVLDTFGRHATPQDYKLARALLADR